jgi:periplasmic protein TonB
MKQLFVENGNISNGHALKCFNALLPTFSHQNSAWFRQPMQSFYAALTGEESPSRMLMWLALLVALLHIALAQQLFKPLAPITPAIPPMMEVALISPVVAPQQSAVMAKPVSAPKPKPPTPAKQKPLKPLKQKPQPVARKPAELPKQKVIEEDAVPTKTTVAEPMAAQPHEAPKPESAAPPTPNNTAVSKVATAPQQTEVVTRASLGCALKPIFDGLARRQPWKGRVMLRVKVATDGASAAVQVKRSSGHEELDNAAVDAVKQCSFKPAKRGDTPVSSFVSIPFDYHE